MTWHTIAIDCPNHDSGNSTLRIYESMIDTEGTTTLAFECSECGWNAYHAAWLIDLLDERWQRHRKRQQENHERRATRLRETLATLGIEQEAPPAHPAPVSVVATGGSSGSWT